MSVPIAFVELRRPEKARHLCDLAERFYQQGHRVLLMVEDDHQGVTLDDFLWTWKKLSFVPHAYDNGAVDCLEEPVVIATEERNANGADVLIMGRPCSIPFMRQFRRIVAFAELYEDELRQAARERWRQYREAGFAPALHQ